MEANPISGDDLSLAIDIVFLSIPNLAPRDYHCKEWCNHQQGEPYKYYNKQACGAHVTN